MSSAPTLSLLIEPEQLHVALGDPALLIIDLSDPAHYADRHIVGAIPLDYAELVRIEPPALGLTPDEAHLSALGSRLGLSPQRHVVAYDDEGNGRAGRLLWTLAALGHERMSLLNGGLHAWEAAHGPLELGVRQPTASHYQARFSHAEAIADKHYILSRLDWPELVLLDTRSPAEYVGSDLRAARGGHIPGAVNLNWTGTMDPQRQMRFQPDPVLRKLFERRGVTPDKEIVVYCQSHRRSAHTYCVLRYLGYPRVRGYPGSWSEWGNDPALPVEV
ncbi:MAG: sulfurtransferase [Candidatus Competibacteraceae bacterium]|nr:sulfurtransferase [Candidatus Competibacteraceae bacterium]